MAMMKTHLKRNNINSLRKFLRKYPDTGDMEILIPDLLGVLRGKKIQRNEFEKIFSDGFCLPGGIVLLDSLGNAVPEIKNWSAEDGDPDTNALIVPSSIAPIPWSKKPSAQALFRLLDPEKNPFFADPRTILERAIKPLKKMTSKIVMAAELEFYLLDARTDRPTARVSRVPGIGRPQPGPQVYHPDDLWDIENFINDLHDFCKLQNIPAGTTISEFAPAQFEVNLHHTDDPVLACDHAVLLKRAIKAVARLHNFVACFMAKPFEEESGSGLHIHMSLYDNKGKNFFSQGKKKMTSPPYSAKFRHAIGGLTKTMAEAMAIFAPNINSYRRLQPEMFAPVEPNWGPNHRNVALRIPISDEKNLRFEHRTSGADANPYLVTAAILSGVHYGIKNHCDPGKMIHEGEIIQLKQVLPNRWDAAINAFSKSKIFPEYLGHEFCQSYVINRRYESNQFHKKISNHDFDWYMRSV